MLCTGRNYSSTKYWSVSKIGYYWCDKKNYQNQLTEIKVYFRLQLVVHHPENSGKELKTETGRQEAGTKSEAMEEFSQPACFPQLDQLHYRTQDHLLNDRNIQCAEPFHIEYWSRNHPTDLTTEKFYEDIFSQSWIHSS